MRQQNTKATVPLDVVSERRTERCSPRFRRGGCFWSQVSDTCRQAGREMLASRPYVTKPFRNLGSINNWWQFLYIQQHSSYFLHVVRPSVSCGGAYLTIAHVLFAETLLVMAQSHYKSCVFPYGTRWCILAQNTWHPHMCTRCTNKIVCYLVWISFSAALVKTFNINAEKYKFYSSTVIYFTLADVLETNKVQ